MNRMGRLVGYQGMVLRISGKSGPDFGQHLVLLRDCALGFGVPDPHFLGILLFCRGNCGQNGENKLLRIQNGRYF